MEKDVLEKMFNAYYMRIYSYLLTLSHDSLMAEELAQETFYRALNAEKSAFKCMSDEVTWLCAIAKNLFTDEMRRHKKHGEMPAEVPSEHDFEKNIIDKEASFKIHCILHTLDEPYREVFELRIFGELSFKQIGQIFRKTENWARVTYHRARLKIQERMDDENE